jgi:integrase
MAAAREAAIRQAQVGADKPISEPISPAAATDMRTLAQMEDDQRQPSASEPDAHDPPAAAVGEAASNPFTAYLAHLAPNTRRAQRADLACFAAFLRREAPVLAAEAGRLQTEPAAWAGVTAARVAHFQQGRLAAGDTVATVNRRLATLKTYCRLAAAGGVLDPSELARIQQVPSCRQGVSASQAAQPLSLTPAQVEQLKAQPHTPQGLRDTLLMCLLLEQGLRVGEVVRLEVDHVDLAQGTLRVASRHPDRWQTHTLAAETQQALQVWLASGDCATSGPLLRASRKGGALTGAGLTERAAAKRVATLGRRVGVPHLSSSDCRRFWATEQGAWSSAIA